LYIAREAVKATSGNTPASLTLARDELERFLIAALDASKTTDPRRRPEPPTHTQSQAGPSREGSTSMDAEEKTQKLADELIVRYSNRDKEKSLGRKKVSKHEQASQLPLPLSAPVPPAQAHEQNVSVPYPPSSGPLAQKNVTKPLPFTQYATVKPLPYGVLAPSSQVPPIVPLSSAAISPTAPEDLAFRINAVNAGSISQTLFRPPSLLQVSTTSVLPHVNLPLRQGLTNASSSSPYPVKKSYNENGLAASHDKRVYDTDGSQQSRSPLRMSGY